MREPPSDGLGDGTQTTETIINVDVTTLTQQEAAEYRRELLHAYYHPGTEYDANSAQGAVDEAAYLAKIKEADDYLLTFKEKI